MKVLLERIVASIVGHQLHWSFTKAVSSVSALRIAGGGLLFISQVLLAGWMGPDAFGRYSYAWSWVAVLATLGSLGIGGASVRFIAAYRTAELVSRLRGLLRFGRTVTIICACIITVLALIVVLTLAAQSPYRGSLTIAFFAIPVLLILALESAYARGFDWMALSVIGGQISRPAFLILGGMLVSMFTQSGDAEPYVLACGCAYLLAAAGQHLAIRRRIAAVVGSGPREYDVTPWVGMAGAMLLLNGSQTIRANTDLLLVGQFLQPAELGVYTAVVRTATLVAFILSVASLVAQPTIAALHAKDELYELRKFIRHVTRSIFVASLAVGVGVVVFGEFVLALFGNEFVSGYKSLITLVIGHVLSALFGPMTSLLVMTDKQYYAATLHILSILLTIVLNLVLIPRFGIEGAAAATAISLFLTNVGLAFSARRLFDFSRRG